MVRRAVSDEKDEEEVVEGSRVDWKVTSEVDVSAIR